MAFTTYQNISNRHVTIHVDGCTQIKKHGGTHAHDQGSYYYHKTYSDARAHAEKTGLPIIDCSFCNPRAASQYGQGKHMKDKFYEEVGRNYRFFLTWRHAVFAGVLVILWGGGKLLISAVKDASPLAWLIPLLASLAIFCLWVADKRTRQIYRKLVEAGDALEDGQGPYKALKEVGLSKDAPWFPKKDKPLCKLFSQSFAINCFFLGSSIILFIVGGCLLYRTVTTVKKSDEPGRPNQPVQVETVSAPSVGPGGTP